MKDPNHYSRMELSFPLRYLQPARHLNPHLQKEQAVMFETVMLFDLMERLQKKAHNNSVKHGFWEGPTNNNVPTKLCLIHSEVSEWLEAYRKDPKAPTDKMVQTQPRKVDNFGNVVNGEMLPLGIIDGSAPDGHRPITCEEEEAADVFIRLLDLCEARGIDLARVTLAKMSYNESRPHMHGGKKV